MRQIAAKWFVLPMVEQQNAYNATLLQTLEQLRHEHERLAAAMTEYKGENAREIGELTVEVRRLRRLVVSFIATVVHSAGLS